MYQLSVLALTILVLAAEARIVSVSPSPGTPLEAATNIQLHFDPPMQQSEFNGLGSLISLRDDARGRLRWSPAASGGAPYSSVYLIPQGDDWPLSATIRLEARADSSLADTVTMESMHFSWPRYCTDCQWIGSQPLYPVDFLSDEVGVKSFLPMDFNNDDLLDILSTREEFLLYLGLDTCLTELSSEWLDGEAHDLEFIREMKPMTIGASASGLHSGQGYIIDFADQNRGPVIFSRIGVDNLPDFDEMQLLTGDFLGRARLASPLRMSADLLCQDLLVATDQGALVQFMAENDCRQLSENTNELRRGFGSLKDLEVVQGRVVGTIHDTVILLGDSLSFLVWDGQDLINGTSDGHVFAADTLITRGLNHLDSWSNHDPAGLPDIIAWNEAGKVVIFSDIDVENRQVEYTSWQSPFTINDIALTLAGEMVLASDSMLVHVADPLSSQMSLLVGDMAVSPIRIGLVDLDGDEDADILAVLEDGSLVGWRDQPSGADRISVPSEHVIDPVSIFEESSTNLSIAHAGQTGNLHIVVSAPPGPGFPLSWMPVDTVLAPGGTFPLQIDVYSSVPIDTVYSNEELRVEWSFDDCEGQSGELAVMLDLAVGFSAAQAAVDSLFIGENCGGNEGCLDEECTRTAFWLRNSGNLELTVNEIILLEHPNGTISQPESFCLLTEAPLTIEAGDSSQIELAFCPQMTEPWPWLQACLLEIHSSTYAADSLLQVPLAGLLSCEWPPYFHADLPQMTEDSSYWLDIAEIVTDPDNESTELLLTHFAVVGSAELPPDQALSIVEQDGLRILLEPGPNVNSELYPELSLDMEIVDPSGNALRDTLLLHIQAIDDDLLLVEAPASDLVVVEGQDHLLEWSLADLDGDLFDAVLQIAVDAEFANQLALIESDNVVEPIRWTFATQQGDSIRYNGSIFWRLGASDRAPAQGSLFADGEIHISQMPLDVELSLVDTFPEAAQQGDSLLFSARIYARTGYTGDLLLQLRQDQRVENQRQWEELQLASGEELFASFVMLMPADAKQSCWDLQLFASNPAEQSAGNELAGCIDLTVAFSGPEHRAFTPNGDGVNDELIFHFSNLYAKRRFRIELFDINGRLVLGHDLGSDQRSYRWNGMMDGEFLLPGVYVYILLDGSTVLARGQVGLVR